MTGTCRRGRIPCRTRSVGALVAVAAIAVCATLLASCSRGGGGGGAPVRSRVPLLTAVQAPALVHAGTDFEVEFSIQALASRKRVAVTLEMVPFDPLTQDLAGIDPATPGYEALELSGTTVEGLGAGEDRTVRARMHADDGFPPGVYAAVLRADKYDYFGRDDLPPETEPSAKPHAPFAVASSLVEVVLPALPDIAVLSLVPERNWFRAAETGGVGPAVDGIPETGDVEDEGDLAAAVVLTAWSRAVAGDVRAAFELGIPDAGGAVVWHALQVIDRPADGAGTALVAEYLLAAVPETGNALEEGERRGFTVDLVLPQAARDDLLAREEDTACRLRVTADPADLHTEWNEESAADDNVLEATVVHLGPEVPGKPQPALAEAAAADPLPKTPPGVVVQPILSGDRLDGRVKYPLQALGWGSGDRYGDKSTLGISYRLGATLTYDTSSSAGVPSGRKVALRVPSRGNEFVKAENGGGSVSTYNSWIGSWEQFAMGVVSRDGSQYLVRFLAHDGVHEMNAEFSSYPPSSDQVYKIAFRVEAAQPGFTLFRITDLNGGELVGGDEIALEVNIFGPYRPVVAVPAGLGYSTKTGATATRLRIFDADPGAKPRKAKFITDNGVDFEILGKAVSLLKAAAAAEFDSEDVARTYFDWEVRVLGAKVFGEFVGAEAASATDLRVKTLWDTKDRNGKERFVKSQEKSASATFWVGPVPIKVEAGGKGSLGIKGSVGIEVQNRIGAEAGPFVSFTAFAGAGLDVFFASVSLRGELTLLKVEVKFKAGIQIAVGANLFGISISAPLTLETMSGRIYIHVTWNLFLWSGSKDFDIVSWRGWRKTWDLFPPRSWSW